MSAVNEFAGAEAGRAEVSAAPPVIPPPEAEARGPKSFPSLDPDAIRLAFETGHYPYPRRMGRVAYEREKARLQAELLKVQIWPRKPGRNSSSCSKAATPPARAARSSASWSI